MDNKKELIIEDALQLCLEIIKDFHNGQLFDLNCYISMEEEKKNLFSILHVYVYKKVETPFFLEKLGIIEFLTLDDKMDMKTFLHYAPYKTSPYQILPYGKGFYKISFNIVKAEEWVKKILNRNIDSNFELKESQTCSYSKGKLFLKLENGQIEVLDLSTCKLLKPIFESFYKLNEETGKNLFSKEEILKKYEEITGEIIEWRLFIKRKSTIIAKKINIKPSLRKRIIWEYDKKEKKYRFEILTNSK